MKHIKSHRAFGRALVNYRIDIFYRGINLASSVMAELDLRVLLNISGYLQVATFEQWIKILIEGSERPQFYLDPKGSVIYYVTPTDEQATHYTRSIH